MPHPLGAIAFARRAARPARIAWLAAAAALCLALGPGTPDARADAADAGWRFERRDEDRAMLAILPAGQSLLFAGQPVEPRLVVACLPDYTDLWIDFGRPVHPARAPLRANLRLDRGRPTTATWNVGPDQRRAHMVEDQLDTALRMAHSDAPDHATRTATELARKLAAHERLAIRTSTAYGGHVALSFDLAGMDDALRHLAESCSWSESVRASLH